MVNGQNLKNNQSITTFYFNNGRNTSLSKNRISRTCFNSRTSINATRNKMNKRINYLQMLNFSCKFKHYLSNNDFYNKH